LAAVSAIKAHSAVAHMLAGVACCGCAEPLAIGQRALEGASAPHEENASEPRTCPATDLLYEGFFHLIEAVRLDSSIEAPAALRDQFDAIADDLAYVSRRELHAPADRRKRYSLRIASVAAAVLLRRLTRTAKELPGVMEPLRDSAVQIIEVELSRTGGDAMFY